MRHNRMCNMDILRTISMITIVVNHVFIDSGIIGSSVQFFMVPQGANYVLGNLLLSCFYLIGVNCFVMITGYFLITRVGNNFKKIASIWCHAWFYLFGITLVFYILGLYDTTWKDLINSFLVVHGNLNWFVKCYIGLLLVAPFLSILAQSITRRQYLLLLIVLTLLSTNLIKPINFPYGGLFDSSQGSSLSWFCYLYLVAGYISLYKVKLSSQVCMVVAVLAWLVISAQLLVKIVFYTSNECFVFHNIGSYNGALFVLSLSVFCAIANSNYALPKSRLGRLMFNISPYMFGVFLLHSHFKMKLLIWDILDPKGWISSPFFIPYLIGCVILIFMVGICMDCLRAYVFKALTNPASAIYCKLRKKVLGGLEKTIFGKW